jgi:hypothetical protein
LHLQLSVELSDGRYTLVPEGGDEGVAEELQYMDVAQGLDQSPERAPGQPCQRRQAPDH